LIATILVVGQVDWAKFWWNVGKWSGRAM